MLLEALFSVRTLVLLAVLASAYLLRTKRRPLFPVLNTKDYVSNAATLIASGLAQHQGPITLPLPNAQKIILPSSLTSWVKTNKNLDHRELVRQDFYADYPGFEGLTAMHSVFMGDFILDVIRAKLGQNDSIMPVLNASAKKAVQAHWGDSKEWHAIDWHNGTTSIIARVASSVFVGPEKCDDEEWLALVQAYVGAYFSAVGELHAYPAWSRRIVQRFLPNAVACRKYVAEARVIMNGVVEKRRKDVTEATLEGRTPPAFNDVIAWTEDAVSAARKPEAGDIQLSLAMAAFFTTSELFRQVLIDVAMHPEIVAPLRDEAAQQLETHGISVAAIYNMVLMDSVLKESQRRSAAIVALERVALKDTVLPDGKTIPQGSHIMVDCSNLWDPALYPNPDQFDGYRFLRKRKAGDKTSQFPQSSPDYNVFGGGRHLCPGRFLASNELKLTVAHILLNYDIRLAEGYVSKPMLMGVYQIVDPMARLEVRKR